MKLCIIIILLTLAERVLVSKKKNEILRTNVNTCKANQNEENKITNDISTIFKENIANSEQIMSLESSLDLDRYTKIFSKYMHYF